VPKDKIKKLILKKPSKSQLNWLTHVLGYEVGISSQKWKHNKSRNLVSKNLMSNDKTDKKINF